MLLELVVVDAEQRSKFKNAIKTVQQLKMNIAWRQFLEQCLEAIPKNYVENNV